MLFHHAHRGSTRCHRSRPEVEEEISSQSGGHQSPVTTAAEPEPPRRSRRKSEREKSADQAARIEAFLKRRAIP
jgi:hypothetical protein